ncbi:protein-L-isoaspartate(D-aspartate) O-methyltransferase [Candidatus Dojkabacteria bacterium]|nr:protein-L-isoaspartate(D-aspartate) O-methyltransferase [Candidatus Dojkabacteria bacterium]
MMTNYKSLREEMVQNQLKSRGINDQNVIDAFSKVQRENFVPDNLKKFAYSDNPLPIGHNVTISQPYIVALMCQILDIKKNHKILDIGTGSGYQAAILSQLCDSVISIEVIPELADQASERLRRLGYHNIKVIHADGTDGYPEEAPYHGIKTAAATPKVPDAWKNQIIKGGKIVFPKSKGIYQELIELRKKNGSFIEKKHGKVRFVPLVNS